MKQWGVIFQELKAIRMNKKLLIPIVAVLFIPVLYAGMFLWAFWDPYGKLSEIPVAVVNLDKGTTFEGETIQAGEDLVKELKDATGTEHFGWHFVSLEEAKKGFENRKYYMMIQIPADFSQNITTLTSNNPTKLQLDYIPNESLNFLSAQIGQSGMEKIKAELQKTITKTYVDKLYTKVANGLTDATDGAGKIKDGTQQAKDGATQLTNGLITFVDKSKEFNAGMSTAKDGSEQLASGLNEMASKTPELSQGVNDLKNGSSQLREGLGQLATKSNQMTSGVTDLKTGSMQLKSGITDAKDGATQLKVGLDRVNNGVNTMQQKVEEAMLPGAKQLLQGAQQVKAGMQLSSDGINQLNSQMPLLVGGSKQVTDGASALTQGLTAFEAVINQLTAGLPAEQKQAIEAQYAQLVTVSQQVQGGAKEISTGLATAQPQINQLAQGQQTLVAGAKQLVDGQQQAVNGVTTLNDTLKELKTGTNALATGAQALTSGLGTLSAGSTTLDNGLGQLQAGSTALVGGVNQLQAGSVQLDNGLGTLKGNTVPLIDGINQLQQGASALNNGLIQLKDGSSQFVSGANQLQSGSNNLANGLNQLNTGAKELQTQLASSAKDATKSKENGKQSDMFASPVNVTTQKVGHVPNYGTGFAPYFLSLGLFVGALMISIVFPLRQPMGTARTAFGKLVSKSVVLMGVGIIQAIIASSVLLFVLGIEVTNVPLFFLFSIFVSWTFLAVIQFVVTAFGDVGRFLAVIILILQLTTSAGTFPLELIPNALQPFYHWLPMSYTVAGFKAIISSGDMAYMWHNVGILVIFTSVLLVGTYGYFFISKKRMLITENMDIA